MEHKGLVSRVAEQLERMIALGQCPQDTLPSERMMAKRYGVSRTTIRGALQGLAARGLIVQHPGRQSRAVALGEALSLESLKLLVPEGRTDLDRRQLLGGYFALKREVTVELLAACCEHATKEDIELLLNASFALRDDARWKEERKRWVEREFDLLRLAARAADRPGHALLILSLEKAFRSLADWVLPQLPSEAIQEWALFVFNALCDRDAQALRRELPGLLKAADEPLLDHLAPVREAHTAPESSSTPVGEPLSGETGTNRYACRTSSQPVPATGELSPLPVPDDSGATSASDSPTGSLASLAPGEFHDSSDLGSGMGPPRPVSARAAPSGGPGSPPTLLLAFAPFSSSNVHDLEADGGQTPPGQDAAAPLESEEQPGSRHESNPEGADNPTCPVVRGS